MRKTLLYLVVVLIVAGTVSSCRKSVLPPAAGTPPPDPEPPAPVIVETEPPILTAVTETVSNNIKGYYQAVPARYEETEENYPLMIYFHGGGQYGNGSTDLPEVLVEGVPKLLNAKKFPPSFTVNSRTYSFIVIAPQFVNYPTNADIEAIIAAAEGKFRIDPKRIYLSGFSLGGRMLSDFAAAFPNRVAAITSMGGLPAINKDLKAKVQTMANAKLPVWHFHNRDDSAWAYNEAERYIDTFKSVLPSIPPKFTTFDVGEGKSNHDCWTRTTDPEYKENGKNIYEWMLGYSR